MIQLWSMFLIACAPFATASSVPGASSRSCLTFSSRRRSSPRPSEKFPRSRSSSSATAVTRICPRPCRSVRSERAEANGKLSNLCPFWSVTLAHETDPSSPSQDSQRPRGLLDILVAVLWGVLFGAFFSKLRTPVQESIRPKEESRDKGHRSEELSGFSPQIPPTPTYPENPCKCCHHTIPWWKIILDVGMFIAAAGAFGAAGYYAHITEKMWTESQRQTCIQREAAINAERAWVGLDG